MFKKFLLVLMVVIGFSLSANAIVWRETYKVCGKGAELTLYGGGRMVFWYEGQSYNGTYNIDDGYLNLYQNGEKAFSFKYYFNDQNQQLYWVDINVGGATERLTSGGCR